MTNWFCDPQCKISQGGAGPWDDQNEIFSLIRNAHKNCPGFKIGTPKLKGQTNWRNTEIEKQFSNYFNDNVDEWFHNLVSYCKGPNKSSRIKDKWKGVTQA
jgi:hypothetical protein